MSARLSKHSLRDAAQDVDETDQTELVASVGRAECRRFYILSVFSVASAIQGLLWMTYSSVPQQAAQEFLLLNNDSAPRVLDNILLEGPVAYVATVFLAAWMMQKRKGLFLVMLVASAMCTFSALFRIIPMWMGLSGGRHSGSSDSLSVLWWVFVAQAVNAAAAPFTQAAPSLISQNWFPTRQRALATGVARVSNACGRAVGFLIGPWLVKTAGDMDKLLYVELASAVVPFVCVLIHFPSLPKQPPSVAAAAVASERGKVHKTSKGSCHTIGQDIRSILTSPSRFPLLLLAFGLQMGAYGAWSGVLQDALEDLGFSPTQAGWLGFSNTLAGIAGGLVVGAFVGLKWLATRLRLLIVGIGLVSAVAFGVLALSLPPFALFRLDWAATVVFSSVAGFHRGCLDPLFFELSTEMAYPAAPGTVGGILTVWVHLIMIIILLLPPAIVSKIAMALMPCTMLVCCALVVFVRDSTYRRLQLDAQKQSAAPNDLDTKLLTDHDSTS